MLLQLFIVFFQVGLLSVGGGYASLASINNLVVDQYGWLTANDLTDLITLSQMTPGPLAINAATFVGTKMNGLAGAIVATIGFVLPAFLIVLTLSVIYYKYKSLSGMQLIMSSMRPVVVGLIGAVCYDLVTRMLGEQSNVKLVLLICGVVLLRRYKVDPMLLILSSGIVYWFIHLM